ncbi:MAG: DUF4190 domain-containing protein [Verrucomicrobia bacterium]|nr:DUF4190 domain-containing protein [Verrucomicrobiota bacterium]
MNKPPPGMHEEAANSYLSWQGEVSGPHSIRAIRAMLKRGKIHSLYKIQVDQDWLLLRDWLADADSMAQASAREASMKIRVPPEAPGESLHATIIPLPEVLPDAADPVATPGGLSEGDAHSTARHSPPAKGLAITSFVLALFFFIPIVNGITSLLALICGHLALARMGSQQVGTSRTLAMIALWITYVQMGFMALSAACLAIAEYVAAR